METNETITAQVEPAAASELDALRAEAESLRAELAAERRVSVELREFCSLFPETAPTAIPDEVWAQVKAGIPLSAAYALHERRAQKDREAVTAAQARGKAQSSGALEGNGGEMPYTPDEVRAMSPAEVRRNYTAIVASMKRWG